MSSTPAGQSVITSDVEITGAVKSAGSVRMEGKLDGDIVCSGEAVIGKTAKIKGTISASSVSIEGTVNGTVSAKDKVEMKASAHITGDVKSKRLAVEDGVTFVGRSDVNPSGPSAKSEAAAEAPAEPTRASFLGKGKTPSFASA